MPSTQRPCPGAPSQSMQSQIWMLTWIGPEANGLFAIVPPGMKLTGTSVPWVM